MKIGADPMKGVRQYLFGNLSNDLTKIMDETVERIVHIMDNLYGCANARYFFVPNIPNVVSDYPMTKKIFTSEFCRLFELLLIIRSTSS